MKYEALQKDLINVERIFNLNQAQNNLQNTQDDNAHQKKMREKLVQRNQLCFLRFCMTENEISSSPELL